MPDSLRLGHRIIRLDETHSTNSLILEREDYLDEHGLVVLARHQTAGRGRIGRRWISLPGKQLQFSCVVHPASRPEDVALVSLVAGLSVAEAVERVTRLRPRLKWPNDVLLDGRKFCGILTESKPGRGGQARLVVGIGINCLGRDTDFPLELRNLLTTIEQAAGDPVDPEVLLQAVLEALDENLRRLDRGERAALLESWRERAEVRGRRVRIVAGKHPIEGTAEGIDEEGRLLVVTAGGKRVAHSSGEVEWLSVS